ncbi:hypothetical protein GCM10009575_036310 [Streptomyces rhizosphaericus]|uniref:Uncharacterized protein n=1 Tax=Streptomyces rhizosphaericus TaxID=114699 RepID=A0ABP4A4N0_9ACTN
MREAEDDVAGAGDDRSGLAREMGAMPDGLSDLEVRPREVHFLVSR